MGGEEDRGLPAEFLSPIARLYDRLVDADFAVELGAEDETLEFPWADPEGILHYYDLKRHPELLAEIEEANRVPELGEFLAAVNSPLSLLETAKCDAWVSSEISPEEEIFGEPVKFGCYVDLLFSDPARRFSFPDHELFAREISGVLRTEPEIPASAQLLVRRCLYRAGVEVRDGLYITFYLFGFGGEEGRARSAWVIGLRAAERALLRWEER